MMAFEYWHSWVKINVHPWLYLNKLWFWCLHSHCMECSGITTHSDICYSLILWNSMTCIDIYKMQWCSLTPWYNIYDTFLHHLYLYLTYIYSDLISHFDTLLDYTIQTLCYTLTQYHISTRQLTFLWLILANNYDYDTL